MGTFKHIDRRQVEEMIQMQMTTAEICGLLNCSTNTLSAWVKRETEFETWKEFKAQYQAKGNGNLRRKLWKTAMEDDNVDMQKFLSKQYLGMADKVDAKVDSTVNVSIEKDVADSVL